MSATAVVPAAGPAARPVAPAQAERGAIASFAWRGLVPAAVFERAGVLWLVFGGPASELVGVTLPAEGGSGEEPRFRELPRLERDGLVAFRLMQRQPGPVRVDRDGATWRLYPGQPSPKGRRKVALTREGDGRLVLGASGRLASVDDPEAGDRIDILLLDEPEVGLAGARAFVDVEFIAASTGVVWRALADGVRATLAKGRLELSRAHGPDPAAKGERTSAGAASAAPADHHAGHDEGAGKPPPNLAHHGPPSPGPAPGLAGSAPPLPEPPASPAAIGGLLEPLRLAGIGKDARSLALRRRELQGELPGLKGEPALAARHDLARLLLADLLAAEALAVLDTAAAPDAGGGPADLAGRQAGLRAAAEFLLGREARAAELLARVPDERDPEIPLWRAATRAALEDWDGAGTALARAGKIWNDYPPRLRFRLGLAAATILTRAGRVDPALSVIDQLTPTVADARERADLALLKGRLLARDGRGKGASSAFATATGEKGLETKVTAEFLDTMSGLERKVLPPGEALPRLSRQRLLWRGHEREPAMLDELAGLEADEGGDLRKAFDTWQTALDRGADEALAGRIRERMRHALDRALAATAADAPDPVAALELYRDHAALLPEGEAGRRLAAGLASRLAAAGLPGQAASLLDERSAAGASPGPESLLEAARHRLAADEPDAARATLQRMADVAPVWAASRRLVSAEAALALGRPRDAYRELENDAGPEASSLRADALWRLADWPRLRSELLGQDAAIDNVSIDLAARAERRLRLAVADARSGDRAAVGVPSPLPRQAEAAGPAAGLLAALSATTPIVGDPRAVAQELKPRITVLREGLGASGSAP